MKKRYRCVSLTYEMTSGTKQVPPVQVNEDCSKHKEKKKGEAIEDSRFLKPFFFYIIV